MTIRSTIEATMGKEGGYSDHPADKGGPTMFGITEAVARRYGYKGTMRDLPRATAINIYREKYAVAPGFTDVAAISQAIGEELFDTGVNMGPSIPSLWLQQILNGLNDSGRSYADIVEDGDIGPGTLAALRSYLRQRGGEGERVMIAALNAMQGARYVELARTRPANEAFLYGWLRGRVLA